MPAAQSQAILTVIEQEMTAHTENLATRSDMAALREDFSSFRGEIRADFAAYRGEIRQEFATFQGEIRKDFAALRGELKGEMMALRAEMISFKEFMMETAASKAEVNALGSRLSWMVLNCFFVQLGVSVGLASLLYSLLKR